MFLPAAKLAVLPATHGAWALHVNSDFTRVSSTSGISHLKQLGKLRLSENPKGKRVSAFGLFLLDY